MIIKLCYYYPRIPYYVDWSIPFKFKEVMVKMRHFQYLLRNRWFSRLPRVMNSYTRSLWSSSLQYPISLTRFGWWSCPRKSTSACINQTIKHSKNFQNVLNKVNLTLTTHSLWPWRPSGFKLLTATVTPVPGFAGEVLFS